MALANQQDFTLEFNKTGILNIDVSGWDSFSVQIINPSAALSFNTTNDGGAVQGEKNGSPQNATNWVVLEGINVTTGAATSTVAQSTGGLFKFRDFGKYFQLTAGENAPATANAVLFNFQKNM